MNRAALMFLLATLASVNLMVKRDSPASEVVRVDLTQWTAPDITSVGDDPFGQIVQDGYALFTDTANQIGPIITDSVKRFSGNNLTCQNCHLQAGTQPYAMPLIGIWGQFPRYRSREGAVDTLEDRINGCMERSMNGRALPLAGGEMRALLTYMRWLSTGIPDGAILIGAGTLRIKEPERAADPGRGAQIYAQVCSSCHGPDGLGQHTSTGAGYQFPPLWGPDSFNNGAGMNRILTAAAYAMHNMPLGTTFNATVLTDEDAYDVAGYIVSQDRPEKRDVDKDFPLRLQKPIDTPYGPYADGFSPVQHKLGPFEPIRAKIQELARISGTAHAGGPDNGSDDSYRVK
jgi:thiosulfate dehydrogenase